MRIDNNKFEHKGFEHELESVEVVDETSVHLITKQGEIIYILKSELIIDGTPYA